MYNKKKFFVLVIINVIIVIIFCWLLFININKNEAIIKEQDFESKFIELSKELPKSVVNIFSNNSINYYMEDEWYSIWSIKKNSKIGGASGIIWSKNWYIITNRHVVEDQTINYSVSTNDWTIYKVDKIIIPENLDIAVLHIVDKNWESPKNLNVPKFISAKDNIDVWQFVLAVWNAFSEYDNTVSFGIISAKNRKITIESDIIYTWLYQIDISIYPGNSWWPVFDTKWQVIGMVTAMSRGGTNLWFAIPLNKEFVEKIVWFNK